MRTDPPGILLARGKGAWVAWGPAGALALLFVVPVGSLVVSGLSVSSSVPWSDPFFLHVLRFTYTQAFLSAALAALLGMGAALAHSEGRFPGREVLWRLSLVPFALPTLLVALGVLGFWSPERWPGRWVGDAGLFGWMGILLAHAFLNFPLFYRGVGLALTQSDREAERAALSLGACRWSTFWRVTFPAVLPEFRSAFVLSFLYCSSSFLIVLFLGGGPRFTTVEVALYQAIKIDLDPPLALRLAGIQLTVAALLYGLLLRNRSSRWTGADSTFFPLYRPRTGWGRWGVGLVGWGLFAFVVAGPLGTLVWDGLPAWGDLPWDSILAAALRSLRLGALTLFLTLALALPLAYGAHRGPLQASRIFSALAAVPVSFSTLVLSFGWMLFLREYSDVLRGSYGAAAVVQATVALPPVFRCCLDGFRRIPAPLYQASASLGATPWRQFRWVEWPQIRGAVALGAALALAFSLGEVGAVVLFAGQGMETLPLWIFRKMGRYDFAQAYGGAVLLLAAMGLCFWWIQRLEGRRHGGA